MTQENKREGFHSVIPYLTVQRPADLIDFVTQSFGAMEHMRATGSAGGMHAEVQIGDSVVMIGGAEHITPQPAAIHLYVPDVDDAYGRALAAGATAIFELTDQPYGERAGGVEDSTGNRWYIATTNVPLEQISKHLHTVTVYFHVIGAPSFIDFLKNAFEAEELMRSEENGLVAHAKVRIGDSVVELGEARTPTQPLPPAVYLFVNDVDASYERALQAGAESLMAPKDQEYGHRNAWVRDAFGNVWYLAKEM